MGNGRERFERGFFAVGAEALGPRLLGARLVRVVEGERLSGVIVETEAYLGAADRAAHTFGGRRTARNEAMYGEPGTAYVYFTYGMHFCMNVVCGARNGVAVLLRALEPEEGLETMRRNRAAEQRRALTAWDLCSGPAKLCRALGIGRGLNSADLVEGEEFFLERGRRVARTRVVTTTRIGIGSSGEWAHKPLRWYVRGNPHVSVVERVEGKKR